MTEAKVNFEERPDLLVEQADDEINLLDIFKTLRRRWLPFSLTVTAVVTTTAVLTFLQTPIFQSKGQLLIAKTNEASALTGLADQLSAGPLSNKSNPIETEIQVLLSIPILENVIQSLDLRTEGNEALKIDAFRGRVTASAVGGTDVIELSYQDPDPQLAADVVNTWMQFYLKNDIEVNRSQTRAARQFISQQIPRAERQLSQAESSLRQFKEKYKVVELSGEAQEAVRRLADLRAAMVETTAQLQVAQERSRQLQSKFGGLSSDQAIAVGKISESRTIQATLAEAKKIEDQLAIARTTYQPTHPAVIDLENKLAAVNRNLEGRIQETAGNTGSLGQGNFELGSTIGLELMTELVKADVETLSMQEKLTTLQGEYQNSLLRSNNLPALEQRQSELTRNLEVARQSYNTLLESYQKAQLAENQNLGNARVINEAQVPERPISPRKMMNLLMGGVLGILGGAGIALLLESRDTRLRSIADVRAIFPYTLLGTVPLFPARKGNVGDRLEGSKGLFVRDDPQSVVSETYRMINTNLKFSRSDRLQVIVVSSSVPGEGKSTTIANLALAMAELGSRVLLMDADMRRPSQHQLWEVPNRSGLSNLLVEANPLQSLPYIAESENLHILCSGSPPPNPTALIDSDKMQRFISNLRSEYDYILIDSPPLTVSSDGVLLSNLADGLILIARPDIANRPATQAVKDIVRPIQQSVLGLVINGVNVRNESDSYYYYNAYYKNDYYGSDYLQKDEQLQKPEKSTSNYNGS
ncbi:GumC family protein [Lyngbya confervoides]|uniref:non-specific protein-tyrosine kinase n=1 Tax=Lyngbya confervoides BDU141951 TaxID=1574623 RepID=A0ABD4T5L3_9CYAN|nr:polysaccharide biosynthesis tyrosine autokinase [Lyngbya confervoides]MCM1983713.1 polysaccharide biosynthesis tyrosine autokinase [Lyngbya confervoides BDU141951]